MCHVPSVINDLWSKIYVSLRTSQHTIAAENEDDTKAIASFYWDDWETVFLVFLRSTFHCYIPASFFWVKCVRFSPCHDRYFRKLPSDFRRFSIISEDFRTLPKIKCPKKFSKTFEHFRSHLKDDTFSVLWYDFVRTQKRTQSHHVLRTICLDLWVRREKLSLMFNWHYMCLLSQILLQKYTNKFHS